MSLFEQMEKRSLESARPLAARMRPRGLDEFVGQDHLLGAGGLLRRMLKANQLGSIILYGPPGTGKTTLARLIAEESGRRFRELNAVLHGVKDLRAILEEAREELATGGDATLLFVDEIHRFNRAQQDAMMADVEQGIVTLVGATTSNPFFAVNPALVSRSQVFQLEPLDEEAIEKLLERALGDRERGLGGREVSVEREAMQHISRICDGDARRALGLLELAVLSNEPGEPLTRDRLKQSTGQRAIAYGSDDEHFDTISALIKSVRGSDADAAIYWLAKMLAGGEDIRFLCRRLIILASEDVGNAAPEALGIAVACMQACEFVGLPECQLTLSQTVTYLALAPKSNAATVAIGAATADIREGRVLPVPKALRDAHYQAARDQLGHGSGYTYSHDVEGGVAEFDYLGVDRQYYHPVDRGFEKVLSERLEDLRRRLGKTESGAIHE